MAKKEISKEILELKKELTEGKTLMGAAVTLKNLKDGKLSKVYLASNCPAEIKKDLEYYGGLVKVPLIPLEMNNEELGVFCKKHFYISVIGVKKK